MTDSQKLDLLINAVSGIQVEIVGIKSKISDIEGKISNIEGKISNIEGKISNIEGRMEFIEDNMATKTDVLNIVSDAKTELYKEIIIAETVLEKLSSNQSKINTLYLKEDTSCILLKSVDELDNRVTVLEKKIS